MWKRVGIGAALAVVVMVGTGATAGPGVPDPSWQQLLPYITWPGAFTLVAWSPVGAALGHWIRSKTGNGSSRSGDLSPEVAATLRDIVQTLERVSDNQDRQARTLGTLHQLLTVLLDRVPRGVGGVAQT